MPASTPPGAIPAFRQWFHSMASARIANPPKDKPAMRRKLVLIVFCLGLVWSLLALGAYTLIDGAGAALVDWVGGVGLPGEVLGAVLVLL